MAKLLKLRRGTTSQHSSFTGAEGEVTVDTDKETLVVHNGSTAAGFALARADSPDSQKTRWGTGNDLAIYHDGTDSIIDNDTGELKIYASQFTVKSNNGGETQAVFTENGAASLYFDNAKKLETVTGGATITGVCTATSFAGDGSALTGITTVGGATGVDFNDNVKIRSGTGNDLEIYHNGTDSLLDSNTGKLKIDSVGGLELYGTYINLYKAGGSETIAEFAQDDACKLYYNNSKKIETSSDGVTVSGDVTVGSGNYYCNDNGKLRLGGSQDLEIYHNGTQSLIDDRGSGALVIRSDNAVDIKDSDNVMMAAFNKDADAKLYYDGSQKLNTESWGVEVAGTLRADVLNLLDDEKIKIGDASDLEISHDGSNTLIVNKTGRLIDYVNTNEIAIDRNPNGSVDLYHNGTKKFETTADGVTVTGQVRVPDGSNTAAMIRVGDGGDLKFYHDGSNSYIRNFTGGLNLHTADGSHFSILGGENMAETLARFDDNGAVKLYYDNSLKFETQNLGVTISGHCDLVDSNRIRLGNISDCQIWHDGTNTMIDNDTGDLKISSSGALRLRGDQVSIQNEDQTESMIHCYADGAVKLYHNNVEMFETMAGGVRSPNGILFGTDTAATNRLSDYEEGTWTPQLGGSGNSYTYHADCGGSYVKIGKLVTLIGAIRLTARSGSNQMTVHNFPFTAGDNSSGDSNHEGGVLTTYVDNSASGTHGPFGHIASSLGSASLSHQLSSGNGSALNADEVDATFVWRFQITYTSA